jgi:cytidyltransferase-like protein
MTVGICSGYFQRFHKGHIDYIQSAINYFDCVVVIVNNYVQQKNKYKDFDIIKNPEEIVEEILNQFKGEQIRIILSIDLDETVCETLKLIRNLYPKSKLYFCKDADRNKRNTPEIRVLRKNRIKYINFLNPKIDSSTEIMKRGD